MQDAQTLVMQYLEVFYETDTDRGRELVEALFAPDCTYTDPHVDLQGPEQIEGFIEQTEERFPGFMFKLGRPIDAHQNQARFQWPAGPADASDAYVGFDVIVAEDGRISNVYGFMHAPAA